MTFQNPEMARGARQLKSVAAVPALFALALAGLALTLGPAEALPEVFIVVAGTLGIAIFMFVYAARPGVFTGHNEVFDDPLRTRYHVPDHVPARQLVAIAPREKVWTRSYVALLVKQLALVVGGLCAVSLTIAGVTLGLGESVGPVWFLAAGVILAVGFNLSHRSGLVDANAYPTEPMAALPQELPTAQPTTQAVGPRIPAPVHVDAA